MRSFCLGEFFQYQCLRQEPIECAEDIYSYDYYPGICHGLGYNGDVDCVSVVVVGTGVSL